MVTLSKIYTKTGDGGTTALGNGERVDKFSLRVEAYGTVDEANAAVGIARLHSEGETDARLARIQNDLFDAGADLCRPGMKDDAKAEYRPLRIAEAQTKRLESEMDAMNAGLQPLKSFVLPGGTALSASLHACRTVTRRAERAAARLAAEEDVNPEAVKYLNRLSDWFFIAARVANAGAGGDTLWTPGANQ